MGENLAKPVVFVGVDDSDYLARYLLFNNGPHGITVLGLIRDRIVQA